MKWLTVSVGAVVIAAVVGGLVWAADLNGSSRAQASTPTVDVEGLIAQKTGLSTDSIHKVEAAALSVAADKAAAAGLITPDQANKLRDLTVGPILNSLLEGSAKAANVSDTDLVDGLSNGKSLAQIASDHGVARDQLKTNLTSMVQTQLNAQQGLVTQAEASMITTALGSYLDRIIDFTPSAHAK